MKQKKLEKLYYRFVKSHTTHLKFNENENNKLATLGLFIWSKEVIFDVS